MQIITGTTGESHVTAEDDRALHAAAFGTGDYVLDVGSKFAATIETSNNIVLSDGELMKNGTHARIRFGETETVVIDNGTTGYNRIDLIVARYQKESGYESFNIAVIKGEMTAGIATAPAYTEGNILEGAEMAEMPLYAVELQGVNIISITPLFTILIHLSDVYKKSETYSKEEANDIIEKKFKTVMAEVQNIANAAKAENETNMAQDEMLENIAANINVIVERVNEVIRIVNTEHNKALREIVL